MANKEKVQKVSDTHYVLPKHGNMKVDGHAYLSASLFEKSEEDVWRQLIDASSYDGVIGAYLMPDTHSGYAVPVGSVIVTEDTLIQSCNGHDISCGILYLKIPGLTASRVRSRHSREKLVTEIEKRIPTGKGFDRPELMPKFTEEQACEMLLFGAKPLEINNNLFERHYIPVPEDFDFKKIEDAYKKVVPQLGSVGGGNHFIEVQCESKTGDVWIMVHCGSRGYGYQIAEYFFEEGAKLRGINQKYRASSYLKVDEPLGKEYWNYISTAANFAIANRQIIVRSLNEALNEVFGVEGETYYEISHNLVQQETLVLPDGSCKKGFVHRKGATRAFPAGHPDLAGTIWETTGNPCLIPGSMMEGAAILFPEAGAYRSACSVNHGSGRIMSRSDAKRKYDHKQLRINDEMRKIVREFDGVKIEGIVSNHKDIPVEECSHVYKNLDNVLAVLEAEGIASVKHRLYPVVNIKGSE